MGNVVLAPAELPSVEAVISEEESGDSVEEALGAGFRVEGLGFRGLGFRGPGFRGLGFRGLGVFRV